MATETTTKLTGTEAIEAFRAAHKEGEGVRVWSQHHVQKPMGGTEWGSEDWGGDLLKKHTTGEGQDLGGVWDEAEWDGKTLELSCNDGWCYSLRYEASPDAGRHRIAYLGAHAGFCWEDQAAESESLKTLLRDLSWDDAELAEFGLACCEDYDNGDDGGYWLVADEARFAAVAEKCRILDEDWDDLDAADVRAYLKDGTLPESEE